MVARLSPPAESRLKVRTPSCLLQLLPYSSLDSGYARDGNWDYRSCLGFGRIDRMRRLLLIAFLGCGCGVKLPMSRDDAATAIRASAEFKTAGTCANGIAAQRDFVTILDTTPVTCESSTSECHSLAKFRWRWRSLMSEQACKDNARESYAELLRDSGQIWRLIRMSAAD
jgi:hypothetical protein